MPDELDKPSSSSLVRKLATILSADVAEFSRLMGEDEEQTLNTFRGHKQVFESLVAGHRGRIFNTAGDAILAEFGSAVEAVRCATDIQAALSTRNDQLPPSRQLRFRIGINLGDVMVHGQDLLGDGVNVAARLQTAAEPGGICISGSVHDQITNKLSLSFQPLGEMNFKNIQMPVRTFSITHVMGHGDLPSPKVRGVGSRLAIWIAAGVLLLAGGGYWAFTVHERSKAEHAREIASAAQPAQAPPASVPAAQVPQPTEPKAQPAQAPPASKPAAKTAEAPRRPNPHWNSQGSPSAAATAAVSSGRYDGVYSGPICYGKTRELPERCYPARGTISDGKIDGHWTIGKENKVIVLLTGDVARSGDVKIEIEIRSEADGSRQATINLNGTLRDGLIDASGSFLKGRPATLNWHKNSGASH
jgi:class 3 adenylate cyclase